MGFSEAQGCRQENVLLSIQLGQDSASGGWCLCTFTDPTIVYALNSHHCLTHCLKAPIFMQWWCCGLVHKMKWIFGIIPYFLWEDRGLADEEMLPDVPEEGYQIPNRHQGLKVEELNHHRHSSGLFSGFSLSLFWCCTYASMKGQGDLSAPRFTRPDFLLREELKSSNASLNPRCLHVSVNFTL